MYDSDIRVALRARVLKRWGDQPHLLVPEVDVRWATPVRIDELLITDKVWGFEIKSDRDTISRLARQVLGYNPLVQRAYLVVGERLREHATLLLPPWWGIWVASPGANGVRIRETRRARHNPKFDPVMLTSYMARPDLVPLLRGLGETRLSGLTVDELRFRLADSLGPKKTIEAAISVMRTREDWQAKAQRITDALIPA